MSKDRMGFGKLPEQKQIIITGKLAKGDSLVEAAKLIRENTMAPVAIILLLYPTEIRFGSASNKSIPEKVVQELLTRLTAAVHGYLAEEAKPEDEDDGE